MREGGLRSRARGGCLRLAALFNRSRDDVPMPAGVLRQMPGGFGLDLAASWLSENPLSAAALAGEAQTWQRLGMTLRIRRRAMASSTLGEPPDE